MQINPLSISLWKIQVFALLFEMNKIIRKVENVNVYWPVKQRDDPSHGLQRLLYGDVVNSWGKGIPLWLTSTTGDPTRAKMVSQ